MHRVINDYRPHQAREALIELMEGEIERCRKETKKAEEMGEAVKTVLESMARTAEVEGKIKEENEKETQDEESEDDDHEYEEIGDMQHEDEEKLLWRTLRENIDVGA